MTLTVFLQGDERLVADAEAAIAAAFAVGGPSVPTVTVTRCDDGLHVRVAGIETRSVEERQAAVVRLLTTLHAFDGSARTISIVLDYAPA